MEGPRNTACTESGTCGSTRRPLSQTREAGDQEAVPRRRRWTRSLANKKIFTKNMRMKLRTSVTPALTVACSRSDYSPPFSKDQCNCMIVAKFTTSASCSQRLLLIHMPPYYAASEYCKRDDCAASQGSVLSEMTEIVCILCRGLFTNIYVRGQGWSV